MKKLTLFLILLLLPLSLFGTTWYVRPAGGSYGAEDGTAYAAAWDGLLNVVWGGAGVVAGDTLYVCGLHLHQMDSDSNPSSQADITLNVSGSVGNLITIRGDYGGDAGEVWNGFILSHEAWVQEGAPNANVYSIEIPASLYSDMIFEDVSAVGTHTLLDKEASVAACQANPGSFYSATYGTGTSLYVHCTDSNAPTDRIVANRWGYQFRMTTQEYIKFLNLDFYCHYRMFVSRADSEYLKNVTWDGCKLIYGADEAILSFGADNEYITVNNCEISWAECGIYHIGIHSGDEASYCTYSNNTIHDIGKRVTDVDSHAIGIQGGTGNVIEGNTVYNCGHAINLYANASTQPLTNSTVRWNFVKDGHYDDASATYSSGIAFNCDNSNNADKSGNECYGNIVFNVDIGYRCKYGDNVNFFNNTANACTDTSFYLYRNSTEVIKATVKNCISLSPANYHIYVSTAASDVEVVICDSNQFHPTAGDVFYHSDEGLGRTLVEWQAISAAGCTFDPNSQAGDPTFVNAGGSFALDTDHKIPTGSPCKDAGVTGIGSRDYFGNSAPSPNGGDWDIGAHEFEQSATSTGDVKGVVNVKGVVVIKDEYLNQINDYLNEHLKYYQRRN